MNIFEYFIDKLHSTKVEKAHKILEIILRHFRPLLQGRGINLAL